MNQNPCRFWVPMLLLSCFALTGCGRESPGLKARGEVRSGMRFDKVIEAIGTPGRYAAIVVSRGGATGSAYAHYTLSAEPMRPFNAREFVARHKAGMHTRGYLLEYRFPQDKVAFIVKFDGRDEVTEIQDLLLPN